LVISIIGEGIVQEFYGIDDEGVFDVLRSVVVNDVDYNGKGERFSRALEIPRQTLENAFIARSLVSTVQHMQGIKAAKMLG
jgi:hypothetical protein